MIRLEDVFPDLPRRGWPGRRRAIARELLHGTVELITFLLIVAALLGCVLLVAASTDTLPR